MTEEVLPVSEDAGRSRRRHTLSLGRALNILDALGGMGNALGVSEISRRLGLPKSTVFRLLTQLVESGYVTRLGTEYRLSLHTFSLGNRYADSRIKGLREIAAPHLGDLFIATGYAVGLAVLDDTSVVWLDTLQSTQGARLEVPAAGDRAEPNSTCVGKVLVAYSPPDTVRTVLAGLLQARTPKSITTRTAFLDEINLVRTTGFAIEREEWAPGLVGVAAPVLLDGGQRAAVAAYGPDSDQFDTAVIAQRVQAAARGVAVSFVRERTRASG